MSEKLWFISEENEVVEVFDDRDAAQEELFYLKEDNPRGAYKFYALSLSDLDNYLDEYDLAESAGFIH